MRSLLTATLLLLLTACAPHVGVSEENGITRWYPARAGGEPMRMRDYFPRLEDADAVLHARGVSDEQIVDFFDTIMLAHRNAPPLDDDFRELTIVRKPGETAADHAMLAEALVVDGYVVRLADDGKGRHVLKQRVSTWDFAVDKAKAAKELERIRESLRAEARR